MKTSTVLILVAASTALATAAMAQEVIETGDGGAPPRGAAPPPIATQAPPQEDQSPEAIGRWARGVLAGAPAEKTAEEKRAEAKAGPQGRACQPPADRKPHGEVWGGIGTGGYREAGAVVTQPVGDCGSVTIAIDKTEFGGFRRRR